MVKSRPTGEDFCPREPDVICMRAPRWGTFVRSTTVASAALPVRFRARIWLHSDLDKSRLVMIIEPGSKGELEVRARAIVGKDGLACLMKEEFDEFWLEIPKVLRRPARPDWDKARCFQA